MTRRVLALAIALLAAPLATPAFDYDESIDGDIASYDEGAPTPIGTLDPGTNVIRGTATAGIDWGDVFALAAPIAIIGAVFEVSNHTGGFDAATRIFETPPFYGLEGASLPGNGSYTYTGVPFPAGGSYGFTAQFCCGPLVDESYDWQWTIRAPEPGATALGVAALASIACVRRRRSHEVA